MKVQLLLVDALEVNNLKKLQALGGHYKGEVATLYTFTKKI